MALGFDFNQLMGNPVFQMGLGMLSQPRSWNNQGVGGMASGAIQGLGNMQQYQGTDLINKLRQQQLQNEQTQAEAMKNQLAAKTEFVNNMKAQPQPRPLAFTPQPGDTDVASNYQNNMAMANAVAAGMPLSEVFTYKQKADENAANRLERSEQYAAERLSRKDISDAQIEARHQDRLAQTNAMLQTAAMHGATMTQVAAMRADAMKQLYGQREQDKTFAGEDRLHRGYATDSAKISALNNQVNIIDGLLAQPQTPIRDQALQSEMAKLYSAGRQAASEVNAWHNPGGLADRLVGGFTKFMTGKFSGNQTRDMQDNIRAFREQIINPSITNLNTQYTETAKRRGYNPENVVMGGLRTPSSSANSLDQFWK